MLSLDKISDVFELLGDWEQRYQYLIELGEKLPDMPAEYMTDDNKVKGCMSQVWVHAYTEQDDADILHYHGECDTSIIRGVLAVLIQLVDSRTADEIQQLNVDELFARLNLDEHLSPNRHVGIYAIVELMKQQAREIKNQRAEVA